MKIENRLQLVALAKEDEELKKAFLVHNEMVAASFETETKILQDRANIHNAKTAAFFREIGVPENFNLLELAFKLTEND